MDIRNLITFIQVAELGSFTRAAERLDYSQSTVSFQIKKLEEELGCMLFERINHTVKLTERGRALVVYAHKICSLTDEFREAGSLGQPCRGSVHIVTSDSLSEDMINTNYLDFYKKYPEISLRFTTADTEDMFAMLERNEADVVMTLDSHIYLGDYVIEKEEHIKTHFVCSAASPLAGKRVSIEEIKELPFILTERGQGYRRVLDRELAKRSIELSPVLEIGRTDIISSVIADSEMISFLPDFVTEREVREGRLAYIDVYDVDIDIWKQFIYHKNKWMSGSLKAFIDYVKCAEFGR